MKGLLTCAKCGHGIAVVDNHTKEARFFGPDGRHEIIVSAAVERGDVPALEFRCSCGTVTVWNGEPIAPDPAPAICGRCEGTGNFDPADSGDDRVCPKCSGSGKRKPSAPAGEGDGK